MPPNASPTVFPPSAALSSLLPPSPGPTPEVVRLHDDPVLAHALEGLLDRHGLRLETLAADTPIPGSYWGDDEAGLIDNTLYARPDTPVHSLLHEACHWLCMDPGRRATVHTDAGGTDTEEHAVCYLQALLADTLAPLYSKDRLFADMDAWGYHFILGSAAAWFAHDSEDAQRFLQEHSLMTDRGFPTFQVRQ